MAHSLWPILCSNVTSLKMSVSFPAAVMFPSESVPFLCLVWNIQRLGYILSAFLLNAYKSPLRSSSGGMQSILAEKAASGLSDIWSYCISHSQSADRKLVWAKILQGSFPLTRCLQRGSTTFQLGTTSWEPSVQTHNPMGDIPYINHSRQELQNPPSKPLYPAFSFIWGHFILNKQCNC